MSTTVSRGIERRELWPPPMRMSRIESERLGPLVLAPGSLVPLVRWSEPRKSTVVGEKGGAPLTASASWAVSSMLDFWIGAEIRTATSEFAIQATRAPASHFRTRPTVIGLRRFGGL